jgi:hypothetical protein
MKIEIKMLNENETITENANERPQGYKDLEKKQRTDGNFAYPSSKRKSSNNNGNKTDRSSHQRPKTQNEKKRKEIMVDRRTGKK